MANFRLWLGKHFTNLILAFTAGGFAFLLAELLLERHWEGSQLIAPVAASLGLILALVSLAGQRSVAVIALFLLLSVSGLFGTFQHFEERTEPNEEPSEQATVRVIPIADVTTTAPRAAPDGEFSGSPEGRGGGGPPWLAPLSLSGLALLGAAATLTGGVKQETI